MILINRQFYILDGKLISYTGKDKSVVIPSEVTSIGKYAFSQAIAHEVIIPGSVRTIESKAFDGSKIEKLHIQDGVKNLEAASFSNCSSLRELYLPSTGLLPICNASSVFMGTKDVETLYLDKISTKVFMFLDETAFPNLKSIYVGKDNVDTFINKLKYKFPNVKVYVDGKIEVEVSSLASSLINQVDALFETLPESFATRLKRDMKKKLSTVRENELLHNSSVVVERLQRLIMNFEEIKRLIPLMNLIDNAKASVNKELIEMPMVGNSTTSLIPYIHYVAMKFNDYEISKKIDNILESTSRRISEYIVNGDDLSVDDLINILTRNLDIEISGLYNQTKLKYNVPSVGKYVDLLDEIRGEKKSGLFYSFGEHLDGLVKEETNPETLNGYSKIYQKMGSYEKFITDEIRNIIKGENTRYASFDALFDDLVKDFKNRDVCFANFLEEYLSFEKIRPYVALVNSLKDFKNDKEALGFDHVTDPDVSMALQRVDALIGSLDTESRILYKNDLDKLVNDYIAIVMERISNIPMNDKYLGNEGNLYKLQTDSAQIETALENELSLLVFRIQSVALEPQDTITINKSISASIAVITGERVVNANDRIVNLVKKVTLEVTEIDQETAFKILEILKVTLLNAGREIKNNRIDIVRGKKDKPKQIFEEYVYSRVYDIYNMLMQYKNKYLELEELRGLFEVKKEC